MKIQRFIVAGMVFFFVIITASSVSFYEIQRVWTLHYLLNGLNQNLFEMEDDVRKLLNQKRYDGVQSLLDKASATNDAVAGYALSLDGKTIAYASERRLIGTIINREYRPIREMEKGVINDQWIRYKSEFNYFRDSDKQTSVLLFELNDEYVFGRLQQLALFFGMTLFLLLALFMSIAFWTVRRWIVVPLEEMTRYSREQTPIPKREYLIDEIATLKNTLSDSFLSVNQQRSSLQKALEETRYLDAVLRTVADINQSFIAASSMEELLGYPCERLALHPGYDLCQLSVFENGALKVYAFSDDPTNYLYKGMNISLDEDVSDHLDPSARAYKERQMVMISHLEYVTSWGSWHFMAEKGRFGAVVAIPVISSTHAAPIGILALYTRRPEGFEPKELSMLAELCGNIGFAYGAFIRQEKLRYHLTTDTVTNLPNRFSLVEALGKKDVTALAIINIDRFSDINEVYGIEIGDGILAGYGYWLSMHVARKGEHLSLYKMGSDEFALLYKNCHDFTQCTVFLEELIALTQKESFLIDDIEIVLTITIGIAPSSERVLEHATAALKQAKLNRRSLEVFSFSSKEEQENNIAWYKRIREAIEESKIVPYFQPIVDNRSRKVIKYEALIRLIDADENVISPYFFLDIAKKTKVYPELTKMMIEKVVELFRDRDTPVSLNLSTQDLINPALADFLEEIIHTNKMGRKIIFEILESEGIRNYAEVSAFVDRFKAIGCRFAIDDFGSGYSNFDHLLKLNVDTLKIDGSLIKNLPHDRNAQIIVRHISDFAHEMGITTVAEFVSSEAIFDKVCELGIDASQGYYFYEPAEGLLEE